jgi:hypothetical protein
MGKVVIMVTNRIILENIFLKEKIWRCHGHFGHEFGLAKIEGSVGDFLSLSLSLMTRITFFSLLPFFVSILVYFEIMLSCILFIMIPVICVGRLCFSTLQVGMIYWYWVPWECWLPCCKQKVILLKCCFLHHCFYCRY